MPPFLFAAGNTESRRAVTFKFFTRPLDAVLLFGSVVASDVTAAPPYAACEWRVSRIVAFLLLLEPPEERKSLPCRAKRIGGEDWRRVGLLPTEKWAWKNR